MRNKNENENEHENENEKREMRQSYELMKKDIFIDLSS